MPSSLTDFRTVPVIYLSHDALEKAEVSAHGQHVRVLGGRQVSGLALRDVAVGVACGAVVAFLTWAVLR